MTGATLPLRMSRGRLTPAFAPDSVNNGAEEIGPEMKVGFDVIDELSVRQNIEPGGFDPTWAWLQGNAGFNGIVIVSKKAFG